MTPRRKAYFEKCSAKERRLRDLIQTGKSSVKRLKGYLRTSTDYPRTIQFIALRSIKTELLAFRHELQRLKGMDRVVVPRVSYTSERSGQFLVRHEHCCCGNELFGEVYCPECGRRILREKVK